MSPGNHGRGEARRRVPRALVFALPLTLLLVWSAVVHESQRDAMAARARPVEHGGGAGSAGEHTGNGGPRRRVRDEAERERAKRSKNAAVHAAKAMRATPASPAASLTSGTVAARRRELALRRERDLPWRLPRQCKNETAEERAARSLYLAGFVATPVWKSVVYAHADAPFEAVAVVTRLLEEVHRGAADELGLGARPAEVYVHRTAESMRNHSCAKADALAYYDGAIHLAPPPPAKPLNPSSFERELETSLRHEYIHHVLIENGIGRPIWLQEALAMKFARELSLATEWRARPLPLADMVELLPSTASPDVERTFYPQAATMLFVLQRLCTGLANCARPQIVEALKQGRATPETLFEWMIEQRAKELLRTTPEALWLDYVARNDFSPEMLDALLARARARP